MEECKRWKLEPTRRLKTAATALFPDSLLPFAIVKWCLESDSKRSIKTESQTLTYYTLGVRWFSEIYSLYNEWWWCGIVSPMSKDRWHALIFDDWKQKWTLWSPSPFTLRVQQICLRIVSQNPIIYQLWISKNQNCQNFGWNLASWFLKDMEFCENWL